MFKAKGNGTAEGDGRDTLVGAGTRVDGKVVATGTLRVDGQVDGHIETDGDVIVGEGGRVAAEIKARNLTIAGEVQGNVVIRERLELVPSGRLLGNAQVGTLVIEEGAVFRGECEMAVNGSAKDGPAPKAVAKEGPQTPTEPRP